MTDEIRELTREEMKEIRELVKQCANYVNSDRSCLHIDCEGTSSNECYMLRKHYTGQICQCFERAVLPLKPILESSLVFSKEGASLRECCICEGQFVPTSNRQKYCSDSCAQSGNRAMSRERMRRKRSA